MHKFCPISLLNTDYKLVMRVWANRLGPILARKIGHHQWGFIPGRVGRNIIDMINAKNEEGAVAFLDQEKAFDMVSFTIINTVFAKLNWLERFWAIYNMVVINQKCFKGHETLPGQFIKISAYTNDTAVHLGPWWILKYTTYCSTSTHWPQEVSPIFTSPKVSCVGPGGPPSLTWASIMYKDLSIWGYYRVQQHPGQRGYH
jgi:hypothetical protein